MTANELLTELGDPAQNQKLLTFLRTFEGRLGGTFFRLVAVMIAPRDNAELAFRDTLIKVNNGRPTPDQLLAAAAHYTVENITEVAGTYDDHALAAMIAYLHAVYDE